MRRLERKRQARRTIENSDITQGFAKLFNLAGHQQQIHKYLDVDSESAIQKKKRESSEITNKKALPPPLPPPEFHLNQHVHAFGNHSIKHTLERTIRYGFNVDMMVEV